MNTLTHEENRDIYLELLSNVMNHGELLSPRGSLIREIEDYQFTMYPDFPCMSFDARKFNLQYAKEEWKWKLSGDRYDDSISKHAKAWIGLKDIDGGYNSNYGQYFFGMQNGFQWVVHELIRDKDSRRAAIPLMNDSHLRTNNPDHVCTESITFRIRNDKLNMSVNMRSNDAIWGLTTDAITFSLLYRMVFMYMKHYYPNLQIGVYTHKADSMHIYERHWEMANNIIERGIQDYTLVDIPWPSGMVEVELLIATQGKLTKDELAKYNLSTPFYSWLIE